MSRLPAIRLVLWLLTAVAAVGLVILVTRQPAGPENLSAGAILTADFNLVTHEGREVTQQDFRDKPTAWFFGFTHCPDVCPTQLADMTVHLAELGDDADKLNVVLITVDPERDTAEVLRDYLSVFDPRIVGLTGALSEIEEMARGYYAFFEKIPLEEGGYTMEHTAGILLTSAEGALMGTLDLHESSEDRLAKLRRLIAS